MRRAAFAALALTGAAGLPAPAQNLADDEVSLQGSTISATISQRFELDSNFGLDDPSRGTSYFTDTRIALGLLNATPTQVFELGLDTGARALDEAEEDFDFSFASPTTASAAYAQEWANAGIEARFRYRQNRVDFERLDFLDPDADGIIDDPDDIELIEGDTTERRYDANVALALATDAPSSYEFTLTGNRFDYSDEGSDRVPRQTVGGSALWRLQFTPTFAGALLAGYSFYEADDAAETEIRTAEIDAGVILRPSEVLELSGGIGYADRREEELVEDGEREVVADDQGPVLRAGLGYAFQDFEVQANARLSAAAPDTRLSGDLRLIYPLLRGRVDARVFQQYVGGSGGDEVRVTGAGLGIEREINRVSRIGLDFAAAFRENQDDPTDEDVTRLEAEAVYSRNLTEVVSADLGYRFQSVDEGEDNAESHAVFFEIGRTFRTGL
jgi:hypothetical protein